MSFVGACKITWQILSNKNFLSFVIMNFFLVLHHTFGTNFLIIFADHLIPKYALSSFQRSAIYGASFMLPQIFIILGGNIIERFGSYRVIMITFYLQIFLGIVQYFIGRNNYYFIALFLVLQMTIPAISGNLTTISMSDIIDEDKDIHKLKFPRSSMIFGTNALVTKPAVSITPMIVVSILNRYGYETLKETGIIGYQSSQGAILPESMEIDELHDTMFNFMCAFPVVLSFLQIMAWKYYQLRSYHEKDAEYRADGDMY